MNKGILMRHRSTSIAIVAVALAITPLAANAGLLDSVTSLVPGASSGAGGGASFSLTGTQMSTQLLVGMRSMMTAVALMHQAVGDKEIAERMNAKAKEMAANSQPSADQSQQWLKTIADNPVDSSRLTAVKDAKSKQFLVQSAGYIAVAGAFNAKAVNTARQLVSMKPSVADAVSAPALLGTANVVVTTVPAELEHIVNYAQMIASFMKDNKLTPPSADEKRKNAIASGSTPAEVAAILTNG